MSPDAFAPHGARAWELSRSGAYATSQRERPWPVEVSLKWMVGFFFANIVLALAAQRISLISTAWALAVLPLGLAALKRYRSVDRLIVIAAYVIAAELLWRGTHARVFWEYGKYVLILFFVIAIIRATRGRLEWRAVLFVACLVPSVAVLPYFNRGSVAFNLSGPVALGVSAVFFSGVVIDRRTLMRLCVVGLGPIVGLAFLSSIGTLRADPSSFMIGGKATTAGIGPNQVASVLGLGIFFVFVLLLVGPQRRSFRLCVGAVGIWLVGQTALSFSRGGLWTAAGSIVVCAYFVLRDRRSRRILIVSSFLGFLVIRFAVLPATDQYTGGMVSRRMMDSSLTGRDKIMKADWDVFLENPVVGVGPGQSYGAHARTFRASSAHTEYTRLLAEHGSFGLIAILMLAWMTWGRWRRKERIKEKGLALAFTAWALLYMGHSAMRLAAPAFMFGIGAALFVLEGSSKGRFLRDRRPDSSESPPEPTGPPVDRRLDFGE